MSGGGAFSCTRRPIVTASASVGAALLHCYAAQEGCSSRKTL
jgi:hypothetical protein